MSFTASTVKLLCRPSWRDFNAAARDPETSQRRLWETFFEDIKDSPYWSRRWGRVDGPPPLDSQPLTEYAEYLDALNAGYEEGYSPLSRSPVAFWALSSGTTSGVRKPFPMTEPLRRANLKLSKTYLYALARAFPHWPSGSMLALSAPGTGARTPDGIEVGSSTRFTYLSMNAFARRRLAIPAAIHEDEDLWDLWAPLYAVASNVNILAGVNPAWIVHFYRKILDRMDAFWPYLEGRERPPAPLPRLKVSRARLRRLRDAFRHGDPTLPQVWPALMCVMCWSEGVSALHLPLLESYRGGVAVVDAPYGATEGFVSVPLLDGQPGQALHANATVVEFLPVDAAPVPENVLKPWELQAGSRYLVLLTTPTGLVRYRLEDVVECTGFHHRVPRIRFRHKSAFMLRVGRAIFAEDQVAQAIRRAGYRPNEDLMLGSNDRGNGLMLLLKEGVAHPDAGEAFEDALMDIYPGYRQDRAAGFLVPLETRTLPVDAPLWKRPDHLQSKGQVLYISAAPTPDTDCR